MSEWIPVADRLPPVNTVVRVLLTSGHEEVGDVKIQSDGTRLLRPLTSNETVTHWRPIKDCE